MKLATILLMIAGLMCFTASNDAHAQHFQVRIKNLQQAAYNISCKEATGRTNWYSTGTLTTTTDSRWQCANSADCEANIWRLRFHRNSANSAEGGRCETGYTSTLTGDGIFTARLYIHSNVLQSDGVFTIAIMPPVFTTEEELDLLVINVREGEVVSGTPFNGLSIPINQISQRWLNVQMTKFGQSCYVQITPDASSTPIVSGGPNYCNFNPDQNRIVINSRARNGGSYKDSFVTISRVSWEAL
ncbi:hypothetical protein LDO26_00010 [Luteimonas sp. BDR2-5]|uniref:hypothetical protein n=1 Tax=Proluteimonas luteida TaxID=2878685 RepID=UPI001E537338|nr:hypothetical protein [Luteimonas sp. BDR2-5]MCD9026600.1 hypothetical protein [Luteimonas sp. BDR2-5]